jgi:hypothetical protein
MEKVRFGIQDKHTGSATLVMTIRISLSMLMPIQTDLDLDPSQSFTQVEKIRNKFELLFTALPVYIVSSFTSAS